MRAVLFIVAGVLVVFGTLFTLQGVGLVGGGAMTGNPTWAVIGPSMVVIGLLRGLWTFRRGARTG